jgi:hypothetical protein
VVVSGSKEGAIGIKIASRWLENIGFGGRGDGTRAKFGVNKSLSDEVSPVRGGVGAGRCAGGRWQEWGGIIEVEQWVWKMVDSVRYTGGGCLDNVNMMATVVQEGGTKVEGTQTMLGPSSTSTGGLVDNTELARGVKGVS